MDSILPTVFETSAILQTEELGVGARFGDCDDGEDRRPWRRLTQFRMYCPRTRSLRQIQEVLEGAELVFSGTVEPFERGGVSQRESSEVGTSGRGGAGGSGSQRRACKVKDIGPILERSFQGYGEEQLLIWISTARAHYALTNPAEEYRPLFEPLQTEADLAATAYNLLSRTPTLSAADLGARLPARLRPHFERLQRRVAQELLAFEFVELPNGARLKMEDLDAIRTMSRAGKKRRHTQGGPASSSPKNGTKMPTEVDPRVHQLVDMGYAPKQARQAVGATKGGSVPDALDWILAKAVETELEEAGSDVTNTPPPEPADVTNTSLPEQADVTSTPGAPPPPSATPGHSKIPPPTAFRNFFDDDEDSSPPLRVNRRRRPNAEQGGVPLGTELPPLDVDSSARTAFGGFGRIQTEGAERGFVGDGLAQPGSERGLTGGLDAGLRRATIEGPKGGLHLDGGAQEGDIRKTLFGGVNLARDSTPVWRAESGRGFGAGEAECRVDGAGGPLAEDRVPVEGVPLRRSDDRPTEPAPSGTGRGIETNAAAEAERDVRSVERCTPVVTAFFQGDISEDIRSGGAEGRNDGTTERQDGTKEPEASVCGEQSNAEVSSRGERVPREEVSSGAKSRLGGLDGAGEPRHVEAADLLSMGPEAQPWKSCGDWKAAGMVDGAPASGRLDGMERNQTESDGSGRSPAEWRGLGRNRTEPEASGWGSMDLGGSDHFPPEPRGPAWNPTEVGGTGLNRTCSGGFGPSKHFGQACTGHRGGFAGTPDFVSRVEEPGKRGSKQETAGPPSRRLSSSNESERFEWAADALRNPTPPRLPKSSLVSQTPPRLPKFPRPSPFSAEDRSTALFERPQSPPAAVLPPSRGDELFGGVRGDAFPGGVDVPLLEAERLQEENHPGAILSLLGEEVEVLIDAFAIWREKAQQYHTAKAVGYDPPSHCHKVKYLADDKEEWVALWREDVKILVWGEDYTEPDDIPVCLDRNGRKGPVKRRKVEPIKAQNDVKRREKKKERSCGAASEEEGPESEVDNEFLPDEDEVIDDGVGDVSAGRRRRAAAARDTAGAAEFEQRWRVAVENGPQTFHFLFENVAHANRGQAAMGPDGELEERENVWDFMQRHLWGIPPEEINSVEFSVANRKRKYPHNIPRAGRTTLEPLAPLRISQVWSEYSANFPDWDRRKTTDKLNMINTKELHPKMIGVLNKILRQGGAANPKLNAKRRALIRSYNLIFTSPTSVANIREEEVEAIMGFPRGHTRCGIPRSRVFELLGNSFQVDTIARILSPLVPYFRSIPGGISVLSLFDGIGGLGVALWRLGVTIKRYIGVEIDEHCRTVVDHWWRVNGLGDSGKLGFVNDIKLLTTPKIAELVAEGPFDLVAGGSPCNNLTGNNRQPKDSAGGRSGLLGRDSRLFLEFPRVLNEVERLQLRAGRACVVTS